MMKEQEIVLVVHNVRSALNVGSLLRTADGLGVKEVYLTGYTPYPQVKGDTRLPHVSLRAAKQIHKTALGAEESVFWSHAEGVAPVIKKLKSQGYQIAALEQAEKSKPLPGFKTTKNIALIVGNEVEGIDKEIIALSDFCLEIPMLGGKESFNVALAAAIALYHLRFVS